MCKEHIHFSNLLIYATHVKDPLLHSESFTGLHCILHKLVVIPLKPAETCLNLRTGMLLLQQKYSFFLLPLYSVSAETSKMLKQK